MEVKLFERCKCKGFYKKVYDGTYIQLDQENFTADLMNSNSDKPIEEDVECAEKIYYEHKGGNFSGVVVGFTYLTVVGYLDVIYDCGVDVGFGTTPDRYYISKRPKETEKCAIVYYSDNKKHYVPFNDIVEVIG